MDAPARSLGLHVGADRLSAPEHAHLGPSRSARDTVERMTRLCAHIGVERQSALVGEAASRKDVLDAVARAAAGLADDGVFVLTFSGHTLRKAGLRWCLYDGAWGLDEVARALSALPTAARLVVVADTCYATSLAHFIGATPTVALIAACGEGQMSLSRRRSDFVVRLEQALCSDEASTRAPLTYERLERELQKNTPDVERPRVWVNRAEAWALRPFE